MAKDTKKLTIEQIINKAILMTRCACEREAMDTFRATEKRLYAYPIILKKIENDKEMVAEIEQRGIHERSKSIIRFMRSSTRLTAEEIKGAVITDLTAVIAGDEKEIYTIDKALKIIEDDPYRDIVKYKYFEGKNDDEISDLLCCDPSTVRRQKARLVARLSVFLYGAETV
jgi:uncharacterized protein YjcR